MDSMKLGPTQLVSPYLSRRHAAAYLNVSEKWLAQAGRNKGPKYLKFGGLCRYAMEDLQSWVKQQEVRR